MPCAATVRGGNPARGAASTRYQATAQGQGRVSMKATFDSVTPMIPSGPIGPAAALRFYGQPTAGDVRALDVRRLGKKEVRVHASIRHDPPMGAASCGIRSRGVETRAAVR